MCYIWDVYGQVLENDITNHKQNIADRGTLKWLVCHNEASNEVRISKRPCYVLRTPSPHSAVHSMSCVSAFPITTRRDLHSLIPLESKKGNFISSEWECECIASGQCSLVDLYCHIMDLIITESLKKWKFPWTWHWWAMNFNEQFISISTAWRHSVDFHMVSTIVVWLLL